MKRRGSNLLETMLAIGLSGVVLSVVASLLAALWRADSRARVDIDARQSLARLEIALRNDVHQATGASIDARGSLVLVSADSLRIAYSIENSRVVRLARTGDQVDHRDSFSLPTGYAVAFGAPQPIVRMTIEPAASATANREPRLQAIVEAALAAGREVGP